MNVVERVKQLATDHKWTEYRLVKESGLPASTVANIFHRNTIPSIATLEIICKTFGITLSQFFDVEYGASFSLEQTQLLNYWSTLTHSQKEAVLLLLKSMQPDNIL